MKHRKLWFSFAIFFLMFANCKNAMLKQMGVKDPQLETTNSIKTFLKEKRLGNYKLYFFKDLTSFKNFSNKYKLEVPEAYFFNKKGVLVPYKKTAKECNAYVDGFIQDLKEFDTKPVDSLITVEKLSALMIDEKGKLLTKPQDSIMVILSFVKYLGKVNDEHTFHWIDLLEKIKKEQKLPISIVLLDADFMSSWDIKPEDLPKIY